MKITVYHKSTPIAVAIIKDSLYDIKILNKTMYRYLNENSTKEDFINFINNRVFPNRKDTTTAIALKELGIKVYDPIEIIKVTNGTLITDKISMIIED